MSLIDTFINNPVKVTVGVLLLSLYGLLAMFNMPMQLTPEVQIPTITVTTIWPGASPQEVEREIIQQQEEKLKSVEGVTKMSSESVDSQGTITLEFSIGTPMSEALLKVNTKLQQVPSYPETVEQPVIQASSSNDQPIAWFILSQLPPPPEKLAEFAAAHPELRAEFEPVLAAHNMGVQLLRLRRLARTHPEVRLLIGEEIDITTLQKFAEDNLESRFERVEGVSNSNTLGGREEEIQVVITPEKLAARQITISDVRNALRSQNKDTSGGDFWEGKRRYIVRTLGQFRTIEQVENLIIARRDGQPVYIRDVATVRLGHKKPVSFATRFGASCIAINAQRAVGANVLTVMEGLRAANKEINETLLKPRGLVLLQVYDETEYIYSAMNLVRENLIAGSILTFITLFLFLRNGRSTVIIFVHILVSTIGAFLLLAACGRSLNVPALGGLAFAVGMLVDNAIVMLENIFRRHQLGESPETASVRGAGEVWGALLNATLANLAVFIPILFVKEEAGQLFRDIALAIAGAVALSMVVAITVVPTAARRMLQPHKTGDEPPQVPSPPAWLFSFLTRPLSRLLGWILAPVDWLASAFVTAVIGVNSRIVRASVVSAAVVLAFLAGSVLISYSILPKVEYLPNGNRNLVFAIAVTPPGYNLDELRQVGVFVENELQPYWDVDPNTPEARLLPYPAIHDFFVFTMSGRVFIGIRAVDPLRAAELVPLIRGIGARLPGTFLVAQQASLFNQRLSGGRSIDIEITGPEIEKLVALGGQAFGMVMAATPESARAGMQVRPVPSLDLSNPEVHVIPKWEHAADLQMSASELGYAVDALVDGAFATEYFSGGDKIDLRIMGDERYASRWQDLAALPIATPAGQLVPLATVATIKPASGPEQINHISRQRCITIQVTPPLDMPLEAAMDMIDKGVVQPMRASGSLEAGYNMTLGGTADKLRATWQSLRFNLLLACIITYLLMAATFESWVYPFVVMLTVPIGGVGGFLGLALLNACGYLQPLDVLTMLGFVMLVGTVVNNPILIVEQALNHMREDGMLPAEAILESVRTRIRPIFMTTFGGLVGLLPLVVAPGAGSELYRGIGAVLLGGLLVSTIATLVFVPAAFTLMLNLSGIGGRRVAPPGEPSVGASGPHASTNKLPAMSHNGSADDAPEHATVPESTAARTTALAR